MSGEQVTLTDDRSGEPESQAAEPDPAVDTVGVPNADAEVGPDGTGALFSDPDMVADHDLVGALEAVLLVVDTPVTETALAAAVGHGPLRVRDELTALAARYTAAGSGIELREIGGGCEIQTAPGQGTQVIFTVPLKTAAM